MRGQIYIKLGDKMKKRTDGRYQKAIVINGKKQFFYGKSPAEVNKKILAYRSEEQEKKNNQKLFSNIVEEWYNIHSEEVAENTALFYRRPHEDVKEYFKGDYISDIKPRDVSFYLNLLLGKGYAKKTIAVRLIVIKLAFNYAIANDLADGNPALVVSVPNIASTNTRDRLLDEEIEAVRLSKDMLLNTLLYTGLRRNEALALHWEDVDFDREIISVNKNLKWSGGAPEIVRVLKTKASIADIPLLSPLKELLLPIAKEKGPIFTHKGKLYSAGTFYRTWQKLKNEYNINCCPHQFRHTFISFMHDSGIDVKVAQRLSRHARVQTTLDVYTHLDNSAINKGKDMLNKFIKGSQKVVKSSETTKTGG